MKNKLTEQWRDGTLKTGSYYIRVITGIEKSDFFEGKKFCFWTDYEIEEVLAPVPEYNQFADLSQKVERLEFDNDALEISRDALEKKLEIATKALKETKEKLLCVELSGLDGDNRQKMYDIMFEDGIIDKALKQIKEVK